MAAQQAEVCLTLACESPVVWTDEQVRRAGCRAALFVSELGVLCKLFLVLAADC